MCTPDDAALAVLAHGLLTSVSLVRGNSSFLAESWDDVGDAMRQRMLEVVVEQADHIGGVLRDLMAGLPPEAIAAMATERRS